MEASDIVDKLPAASAEETQKARASGERWVDRWKCCGGELRGPRFVWKKNLLEKRKPKKEQIFPETTKLKGTRKRWGTWSAERRAWNVGGCAAGAWLDRESFNGRDLSFGFLQWEGRSDGRKLAWLITLRRIGRCSIGEVEIFLLPAGFICLKTFKEHWNGGGGGSVLVDVHTDLDSALSPSLEALDNLELVGAQRERLCCNQQLRLGEMIWSCT